MSGSSVLSGAGCQKDSKSMASSESAQDDVELKGTKGKAVKEETGKKSGKQQKRDGEVERRKHLQTKDCGK